MVEFRYFKHRVRDITCVEIRIPQSGFLGPERNIRQIKGSLTERPSFVVHQVHFSGVPFQLSIVLFTDRSVVDEVIGCRDTMEVSGRLVLNSLRLGVSGSFLGRI